MKLHPLFRDILEGGELLEWGAKTIPEGGYYALPSRRTATGCCSSATRPGSWTCPRSRAIHYAMQSGIYAARAIFAALKAGDTSAAALSAYDRMVDASYIRERPVPDAEHAARLQGRVRGRGGQGGADDADRRARSRAGASRCTPTPRRRAAAGPGTSRSRRDGVLTFSKVDAVFKSGNATRDTIPTHLLVGRGRHAARSPSSTRTSARPACTSGRATSSA